MELILIYLIAVRKHSDQVMLPLECLYLNRTALASVVGQLPQPTKHFALKQKPKSATLRAELLQKCKFEINFESLNNIAFPFHVNIFNFLIVALKSFVFIHNL